MDRRDVIERLRAVEPSLRARGVGALYLFGSYGRDEGRVSSDIDVFVDAGNDAFFDLSNFMGAYADIQSIFPEREIGYSTRDGLSKHVRAGVERDAIRIF